MRILATVLILVTALSKTAFAEIIMDRKLRNTIITEGKVITNTWVKDEKNIPYYIQFIFYQDQFYECRMLAASRENRKVTIGCFDEKSINPQ